MANIYIVDDSRISRKVLANILKEAGHTVCGQAENGKIAFENYKSCSPDLITMDITMPVMDGLEALASIRSEDKEVKILMVTAAGQKGKVVDAVKNGATEFITKPFEEDIILEAVDKCLNEE